MTFGEILRLEREKRGITREDFAKQIGITYSTLAMYERGERTVRDEVKIKIARKLNLSLDYLFGIIKDRRKIFMEENILNKSIDIEDSNGNTIMAISIDKEGNITKLFNCNVADIEEDYMFNTDKDLIRLQAEE